MSKLVGFRLPDVVVERMDALGVMLGLPRSGVASLAISLLYHHLVGQDAQEVDLGASVEEVGTLMRQERKQGSRRVCESPDWVQGLDDAGVVGQDAELGMSVDDVQALLRRQAEERKRRKEERKRKKKASKRK